MYVGAGIVDDGRYNPTSNMSLFQNFTCSGEEDSLTECASNTACISRCATPYGIQCYSPGECPQNSIRLVNGDITQEGRVEICINNVWGAVCGEEWNKIDAQVVCRQLGLGTAGDIHTCTHTHTHTHWDCINTDYTVEPWIYTDVSVFGETPGPILYSNIKCSGWEGSLDDCPKNSYYDVTCSRNSMAGVVCRDGEWCNRVLSL